VAARAPTGLPHTRQHHIEAGLARNNHGSTCRGHPYAKALSSHVTEGPQAGLHGLWVPRKFQLFLNGAPKQRRWKPQPRCKGRKSARLLQAKSFQIISGLYLFHLRQKLDHFSEDQLFRLQILGRPEFFTHHKRLTANELQQWKPNMKGMRQL
jgi:hypothetical protein